MTCYCKKDFWAFLFSPSIATLWTDWPGHRCPDFSPPHICCYCSVDMFPCIAPHICLYCSPYFVGHDIAALLSTSIWEAGTNSVLIIFRGRVAKCSFSRMAQKKEFLSSFIATYCKIYWLACHLMRPHPVAFFLKEDGTKFEYRMLVLWYLIRCYVDYQVLILREGRPKLVEI